MPGKKKKTSSTDRAKRNVGKKLPVAPYSLGARVMQHQSTNQSIM